MTMSVRYNAEEALERIFSDVQQDNSDSEEEVEDLSEEREKCNPEHDESSSEEENPEAERLYFQKMAKNPGSQQNMTITASMQSKT